MIHKAIFTEIPTEDFTNLLTTAVRTELEKFSLNFSPPVQEPDVLFNKKQASEFLQISMPTLDKLARTGIIPFYRLGCNVRFKRSELLSAIPQGGIKKHYGSKKNR